MLKLRYSLTIHVACVLLSIGLASGCNRSDQSPAKSTPDVETKSLPPIKVVVVDDESIATAIDREWSALGGALLTVENISVSELQTRSKWTADVVVYPFSWMGDLVNRRIIRPLQRTTQLGDDQTTELPVIDTSDFFDRTRKSEMQWGKQLFGASLGSPQFLLLYRTDVFEALSLSAPTTWAEYDAVLASLNKRKGEVAEMLAVDETRPSIAAAPLAEGWAAKYFLARSAAYARHRSQYSCLFSIQSFQPQLTQPPFVRALDELRASHESSLQATPYSIATGFSMGKLAMAITWPEAARTTGEDVPYDAVDKLPVAAVPLPGARQAYDRSLNQWQTRSEEESSHVPLVGISGRCVSVCRRTVDIDRAYDFVVWATEAETGSAIARHSHETTVARFAQMEQNTGSLPAAFETTEKSIMRAISDSQAAELALSVPRIPQHDKYMAILDNAIRESVTSDASATAILQSVNNGWEQLTESIGRQQQITAYAESLGINP
ncbi:MAG: extracellular solute-binding protein [Planctomycetales bacterium]|nr:extracellular solute-binding protein [Planctomycetales bacterium]